MGKYLDKDGVTTLWNKSKDTFANKSHTHDFSTDITNRGEAFLTWGGKNFADSYGPIDGAMLPALGANRFAFAYARGITVEYSRDNGETWTDYGLTDAQKVSIFSGPQCAGNIRIGKPTKNSSTGKWENTSVNNRVRVIVDTNSDTGCNIYTILNKFMFYISTEGSGGCKVTIDAQTKANSDAENDTWTTFAKGVNIGGWSGYNVVNTSNFTTYGNLPSHFTKIRFTFYCTGDASMGTYGGLQIFNIYGFGGIGWRNPSDMAKWGNVYTYDANKHAYFPAGVRAPTFYENGTALSSKYLGINANAVSATKSNKLVSTNTRPTSANFDHDYIVDYVSQRLDIASGKMNTGKPMLDGFIITYFWDNEYAWDAQLYIPTYYPDNIARPQVRYRNHSSGWIDWISIPYMSDIPTKVSQLTNDSGYALAKDIPENTSDLTNDSNYISGNVVSNISSQYDEQDIPTIRFLEDYVADKVPSKTTTTIFDTMTNVGTITGAGTTISKTITLNNSVQAGDRLKVYVGGNTAYAQYNSAIIEFELFNPTESTLGGAGTTMVYGASHGIVTARVQATSTTTTSLTVECWCLDASQYAAASVLNILKVERIR